MYSITRRKLLSVSVLAMAGLGLAACAPKGPATTEPKEAPATTAKEPAAAAPTATTAAAPKAAEAVTLSYYIGFGAGGAPAQVEAVTKMFARFTEANPGIVVEPLAVPGAEAKVKFRAMVAAGTPPDILTMGMSGYDVACRKGFIDLRPHFEAGDVDLTEWDEQALESYTVPPMGNMVYGLPFGLNAEFLCYNKTIWDKAGLTAVKGWDDATWTWDAWLEAAKKTTTRVGDQTDVFGALSPVDNARTAQMFGGYFASPDLTKITFDTPEAIKGYVFRQENIWMDRVTPNAGESAALATGFLSGKVGMVMQGTWGVGGYLDITDFEWDFLPIPFASEVGVEALRASPYWPDSLAISSVKYGQQSWDLISWMVLEEANYKEFTQLMSMVPARKGFRAEFYEDWKTKGAAKNWSIIEENFGHASTDRSLLNANWQEALQVYNSGIEAITTNEAQAVDVIPELAEAVAEPWQLGLDMIS